VYLTVLHPAYKLEYFKRMKWSDASINEVRKLVEDQFKDAYADVEVELVDGEEVLTVCKPFFFVYEALSTVTLND
jgi:hypothetical protein